MKADVSNIPASLSGLAWQKMDSTFIPSDGMNLLVAIPKISYKYEGVFKRKRVYILDGYEFAILTIKEYGTGNFCLNYHNSDEDIWCDCESELKMEDIDFYVVIRA